MTDRLTASNIKYLIAIYEIGNNKESVKNIQISKRLEVSKPSAHKMLYTLCSLDLLTREKNGAFTFTKKGAIITEKFKSIYENVLPKLNEIQYINENNVDDIALSILSQINLDMVNI